MTGANLKNVSMNLFYAENEIPAYRGVAHKEKSEFLGEVNYGK